MTPRFQTVLMMVVLNAAGSLSAIGQTTPDRGASSRQGNIVEYFGKEKVDDISEGNLVHLFRDGLVLGRPRGFGGSGLAATPVDPVMHWFLRTPGAKVEADQVFDVDASGNAIQWEAATVDETGTFQDRRLRSGALYLNFTSDEEQVLLLDATGHTKLLVDGMPYEGDHYDFGWTLIPLKLSAGEHSFVMQAGRFGRMRARLVQPRSPVQFTRRDMTLPDLRREDAEELSAAIRIINASDQDLSGGSIECRFGEAAVTSMVPIIAPLSVRKVPFQVPAVTVADSESEKLEFTLTLKDKSANVLAEEKIELAVRSNRAHHKRTFVSAVDGSVQYYSVAPCLNPDLENPAMFLSVHGASVEATNQAAAYQQKDWGHLVAPTNRRPFGFAWEDWGRLDAMEVLQDAERVYETDPSRTYLTGHSMGGHGTWYLGATYPDRWAAIAPCAGYPDLLGYRGGFMSRLSEMSEEQKRRFGITDSMIRRMRALNESKSVFDEIMNRASNPCRTLKLIDNYNQFGVYVLHGEKDTVVPTAIAREMRQRLGSFHSDFTYYEYPNGSHWYGNHSVDWEPIFNFFKARSIKSPGELERFTFATASPGVSAKSHFITIWQQQTPLEVSKIAFVRQPEAVQLETENVKRLSIDFSSLTLDPSQKIDIDDTEFAANASDSTQYFERAEEGWIKVDQKPSPSEKGPHRNGGFKDAFRNRFVLVYGTQGTPEENAWYLTRARSDAQKFWYRGNGGADVISDSQFLAGDYSDRNVVIYGNRDNNRAWRQELSDCPLQFFDGGMSLGAVNLTGSGWGAYFVYPRTGSDVATVGVVTASGVEGMKSAYANLYLENASAFPDIMIFDEHFLERGIRSLKCAGFWGNDWDVETADLVWQ